MKIHISSLVLITLLITFSNSNSMDRPVSAIIVQRTARMVPTVVDANNTAWTLTDLKDAIIFELQSPPCLTSQEEPSLEQNYKEILLGLFRCGNRLEHEL